MDRSRTSPHSSGGSGSPAKKKHRDDTSMDTINQAEPRVNPIDDVSKTIPPRTVHENTETSSPAHNETPRDRFLSARAKFEQKTSRRLEAFDPIVLEVEEDSGTKTASFANDTILSMDDSGNTAIKNLKAIVAEGDFPKAYKYTVSGLYLNQKDTSRNVLVRQYLEHLDKNKNSKRAQRKRDRMTTGVDKKKKSETLDAYIAHNSGARIKQLAGTHAPETSRPLWKNCETAFIVESIPTSIMMTVLTSLDNRLFKELFSAKAKKIPVKPNETSIKEGRARQYYLHWDLNFERFKEITWTEHDDGLGNLKLTATPPIQICRENGIKWFHSETCLVYTADYDNLFHRLCYFIGQHLGLDDRSLPEEFDCFFAIEQEGHETRHGDLYVNNPESLQKGKELKSGGTNQDGTSISAIDVGFEFIMPLSCEGMTLRVAKVVEDTCLDVVPVYIPFGCGLLLRADCYRGGRYGTNGVRRLVVTLVTKQLDWYETMVFCKEKDIVDKDRVFTGTARSEHAMLLALRPANLEPNYEQYHTGSQTLDNYRRDLMRSCIVSGEQERIIGNNLGNLQKYKAYMEQKALMKSKQLQYFFLKHPKWIIETKTQQIQKEARGNKSKNAPPSGAGDDTIANNKEEAPDEINDDQNLLIADAVVSGPGDHQAELDSSTGGGVSDEEEGANDGDIKMDGAFYVV